MHESFRLEFKLAGKPREIANSINEKPALPVPRGSICWPFWRRSAKVTEDGGLTVHTEMKPLGQLTIATHGRGELVSGSVRVVSDGPIGGVLRFDLPEVGVAGVGTSLLKPFTNSAVLPIPRRSNRLGR